MNKDEENNEVLYEHLAGLCLSGDDWRVCFREITRFTGFTGKTMLSVVHPHYFMLGMVMFLILLLLEKNFAFSTEKTGKVVLAYNIGLNVTAIMMFIRGLLQVLETPLSSGANAAISGIAGIGHIILGVALVLLLMEIKKAVSRQAA
ncbi:DUF2871 domain-containing protein [Allobaculum mucilyticum]|uniref:DUF2871 domain-containing protein n=1 Tax=Allobaculum mucilyticum TaxID=2834459 RepID=UPI001E3F30E4|nr:DUF2871 domain-containing protein [Allobaculum mucilyticum]UNT95553.1 DUF2871 domain-containing protein [Allobaculum mucilyticum]